MIHAFKLSTGPDNASHVAEGTLALDASTDVVAVHFKESPPPSSFDWHDAPEMQYVLTLTGTLEFTTRDGETLCSLPAMCWSRPDTAGTGHRWRRVDDQPWRRCYVVLKPDARDLCSCRNRSGSARTAPRSGGLGSSTTYTGWSCLPHSIAKTRLKWEWREQGA